MMKNYEIGAEEVQKLRRAVRLDDESFSKLLFTVTKALGASESQIRMMQSNGAAIRAMISRASDRDLRSLARRVGKEKTAEILKIIDDSLGSEKP